jgi:hypothetical protein
LKEARLEQTKAWITRQSDRERAAYARRRVDIPRQFVIIGTTNSRAFLRDPTGNRRFWPVNVTQYDRVAFVADRDQIFAEACVIGLSEKLWLDEKLEAEMRVVQHAHREVNPFTDDLLDITGTIINDEERIHAKDVYHRLGIDRPKTVKNLVADAMRELGWDHVNSMRIGSSPPRSGYIRKIKPVETKQTVKKLKVKQTVKKRTKK